MDIPELSAGLGRRRFLQLFAGAAAVAATRPLASVAVADDLYVNRRLGFAFSKPAGWGYESLKTFADMRDEYEIATVDEQLQADFKAGQLPIVVASQAPILTSLASSLTVSADEHVLLPDETLLSVFPGLVGHFNKLFHDFEVTSPPTLRLVGGYESIDYTATLTYTGASEYRGPVRHRAVVTVRPPLIYSFYFLDIPARGIDSQAEFDRVIASIRYV